MSTQSLKSLTVEHPRFKPCILYDINVNERSVVEEFLSRIAITDHYCPL